MTELLLLSKYIPKVYRKVLNCEYLGKRKQKCFNTIKWYKENDENPNKELHAKFTLHKDENNYLEMECLLKMLFFVKCKIYSNLR